MGKYIALLFLLLSGTANAQRTLQVYDPDFDSAYCMHEVLYGHLGEECPTHYSQFYSSHYLKNPNYFIIPPYYDSGFILRGDASGLVKAQDATPLYSYQYSYNSNRLQITVDNVTQIKDSRSKGRVTFLYDDQKLLRSFTVTRDIRKDSNFIFSYEYDNENRITHIYRNSVKELKLLHKFTYNERNTRALLEEWYKLQMAAHKAAREEKYKLNKALDKISNPDKMRKVLSGTDIHLLKQFDSVDKSTVFIFSFPDVIYSFKYLPNPNIYVFQTMYSIDLYSLKNARVIQHKSCYFSFGCMMSYYSQIIMRKHKRRWTEWYAYDKKRLKKNKIANAVHIP